MVTQKHSVCNQSLEEDARSHIGAQLRRPLHYSLGGPQQSTSRAGSGFPTLGDWTVRINAVHTSLVCCDLLQSNG